MDVSDSYTAEGGSRRKFFISYRRSADADRSLAGYLKAGLEENGHEVFIDIGMPVGTDWAKEIGERISWCDHLVVLLSEHSIDSEMVQGEVRMAHHAKRGDGRPTILPVRVGYDGPLDYELNSYLSRLQYARWENEVDSPEVLNGLLGASGGLHEAPGHFETKPVADPDPRRPQPVSDPRALRAPGGTARVDDPFYIKRPADSVATASAGSVGETVLIKAPRQMGKSSLLARYLMSCQEAGKKIVYLDFQSFTDAELADYTVLLQKIAAQILRGLRLDGGDIAGIGSQLDFINFIEDHVLQQVGGPVTFGFDEVDRLLGRDYQGDFFAMLRTWHNSRATPFSAWADLDLALVIATEPDLLIESGNQSPFNVAVPMTLECFDQGSVSTLNGLYGNLLTDSQLGQLYDLLAGHPYLTRLAFYRLVGEEKTFDDVSLNADRPDGPFGDHLRAKLLLLQQQPAFLAAFRKLIRDGSQPDQETGHRLHGAGLVRHREGKVKPANLLYARFFKPA